MAVTVHPAEPAERYTHGYHEAVVGSYARRTAEDCAAYLLPRLRPDMAVLDLGCGPGTITAGLARQAGRVVGVDASAEMADRARGHAAHLGVANASFETGSAYDLRWDDGSFDVVHAHQVLQHLADPVRALREALRVLAPGGLLAVRDADYETMAHAPVEPEIEHWRRLYLRVSMANGGEARAGRFLPSWAAEAGFADLAVTTSTTTYADEEGRAFWGELWAVRVVESDFADHAVAGGFATRAELAAMAAAFRRWAARPHGLWAFLHTEVIAARPF